MNNKQLKNYHRREMLKKRKIIAKENPEADEKLEKYALKWLEQWFAQWFAQFLDKRKFNLNNKNYGEKSSIVLASYYPINSEMNCLLATQTFKSLGFEICLPVVTGKRQKLIFRKWDEKEKLTKDEFGVNIPAKNAAILKPDIIFVPLLAFDHECYRLGYGGGFYDITLSSLGHEKPVVSIGIAFAEQKLKYLPREAHDVALDGILTDKGFFSK